MYDATITLKGAPVVTYDEYGNERIEYKKRTIFALPRGVYASEFYNAAQTGLHPSVTFEIANRADYEGERIVTYNENDYNVVRVDWDAMRDGIRLICEERINVE